MLLASGDVLELEEEVAGSHPMLLGTHWLGPLQHSLVDLVSLSYLMPTLHEPELLCCRTQKLQSDAFACSGT